MRGVLATARQPPIIRRILLFTIAVSNPPTRFFTLRDLNSMEIAHPYLLFLGDVHDDLAAKTAYGIVDWRREWCLGSYACPAARRTRNCPKWILRLPAPPAPAR